MKSTFETLIDHLTPRHKMALEWFQKNKNKEYQKWLPKLGGDLLLATKAKGIYKPKELDFALSIRLSKKGPYNDQIHQHKNGKISLKYFQENKNLRERDLEYTNIGLKECMRQTIPIGIIVQTDIKPNSKYKIAGTGIIKKWEEGYYFINIFSDDGEI